jgi:thiamine-phosphate pyrophosphorylase
MPIDYSLTLVADADFLKRIAAPGTAGRDLLGIVEAAVQGGVTVVQIRAKALPFREFLDLGLNAADRLAGTGVLLLVNDRVDIALACGADGVHLGQEDMPLATARNILGRDRIIGISVNTVEEARAAEAGGADYVGAAPAFATATKETALPVLGPEGVRSIKRAVRIPVVAIGGINAGNSAALAASGADGIAVISAVLGAPDARRAAEDLRKAFKRQLK